MALPNSIRGWVEHLQKKQSSQGDCSSQGEPKIYSSKENPFLREVQPVDPDGMAIIEIDNEFKHLITRISLYERVKNLAMPRKQKRTVAEEYHRLTRKLLADYGVNWNQAMKTEDNILRRIIHPYLFNNRGDGKPENSGTPKPLEKLV